MFHAQVIDGSFVPLQDYVVLRRVAPKKEKGGILLPTAAHEYGPCRVMAVGPGRTTAHGVIIPCELKVGQYVYIQGFVEGELKFKLNGEEVYGIRERHINCVLEGYEEKPEKKVVTSNRKRAA